MQTYKRYSNIINPIASGFPTQQGTQQFESNPVSGAAGGALAGAALALTKFNMNPFYWSCTIRWRLWLLREDYYNR